MDLSESLKAFWAWCYKMLDHYTKVKMNEEDWEVLIKSVDKVSKKYDDLGLNGYTKYSMETLIDTISQAQKGIAS